MGHAALTDLETKRHWFSEVLYREIPLLAGYGAFPEPRIGWSRAPAGTDDVWSLDWNGEGFDFAAKDEGEGFGFRLSTRPKKPLVLPGAGRIQPEGRQGGRCEPLLQLHAPRDRGRGRARRRAIRGRRRELDGQGVQLLAARREPGRLGLVQSEARRRPRADALLDARRERRRRLREWNARSTRTARSTLSRSVGIRGRGPRALDEPVDFGAVSRRSGGSESRGSICA